MLWNGLKKHCNHIVLVSGDEDLAEAVLRLKENGIMVTVAAFSNRTSRFLRKSADSFIDLSKHVDKFKI